jgi:hypothetical protein
MKRSEPLRADPAKTRAWQQRSRKPLERSAIGREGMRSTEIRRATAEARPTAKGPARKRGRPRPKRPFWWRGELDGSICAVCEQAPAVQGHHIIRAEVLRREARRLDYEMHDVMWDRRNRLPVCQRCHERHHNRSRPIRREVLLRVARWVFDFAHELGLEPALEREYPETANTSVVGRARGAAAVASTAAGGQQPEIPNRR